MKSHLYPIINCAIIALATVTFASAALHASEAADAALVDDFSDANRTSRGFDRIVLTDSSTGGQTTFTSSVSDGALSAEGEIAPPRGQPGWASMVLLLASDGSPVDLSQYEGIRLRVQVTKGMLSVSANSSEITNFDYHAAMVPGTPKGVEEIRIPFKDMKRAWSEQTALNPATIASISLVAVDFQKARFAYQIDEIGFY